MTFSRTLCDLLHPRTIPYLLSHRSVANLLRRYASLPPVLCSPTFLRLVDCSLCMFDSLAAVDETSDLESCGSFSTG
jgi:hypothetical protein